LNPHCRGCFNSSIWEPTTGRPFTSETVEKILKTASPEWCKGLSILGGEPTASYNIESAVSLAKVFKEVYPEKDIWLWSGRQLEEIKCLKHGKELLSTIDFLVDGRFEEEKKDISLHFRGSSNQRIFERMPLGFFYQIE
jgi:anaerobic ribonucleoside-triphosphate reductase activating protein